MCRHTAAVGVAGQQTGNRLVTKAVTKGVMKMRPVDVKQEGRREGGRGGGGWEEVGLIATVQCTPQRWGDTMVDA